MHNYVHSIQADPERITAILDRLDSDDKHAAAPHAAGRSSYRKRALTVEFARDNGEWVVHIAPSRFLGPRELGVLTGCFICPGTPCRVDLQAPDGATHSVAAVVGGCHYIIGSVRIHEVTLRFSETIRIADFVAATAPEPIAAATAATGAPSD